MSETKLPFDIQSKLRKKESDIHRFQLFREQAQKIGIGLSSQEQRILEKSGIVPFERFIEGDRKAKYDLTFNLLMAITRGSIHGFRELLEPLPEKLQSHIITYDPESKLFPHYYEPETITDNELWFQTLNHIYEEVLESSGYQDALQN